MSINKHIKSIQLKAVLVIYDYALNRFQRYINDVVDLVEALVTGSFALRLFQVKFEICNRPFSTVFIVVICCLFSNCDIRQMDKHVITLGHIVTVFFDAESSKAQVV